MQSHSSVLFVSIVVLLKEGWFPAVGRFPVQDHPVGCINSPIFSLLEVCHWFKHWGLCFEEEAPSAVGCSWGREQGRAGLWGRVGVMLVEALLIQFMAVNRTSRGILLIAVLKKIKAVLPLAKPQTQDTVNILTPFPLPDVWWVV